MAIAYKTVRFAWNPLATAATAAFTSMGTINFTLPELTLANTIHSAYLEVSATTANTNVPISALSFRYTINEGSAGSTSAQTTTLAATGEDAYVVTTAVDLRTNLVLNVRTNGTSNSVLLEVNPTATGGLENVTAVLVITYLYDEADNTLVKTVTLPLESLLSSLPTTETVFSTIPQLTGVGGILPENAATVVDWFIVIEGNTSVPGTSDYTISLRIDTLTTSNTAQYESGGTSANYFRYVYKPANGIPATGATHDFKLWSDVASLWNHCTATLFVTYTFSRTGTTRILNSLILPVETSSPLGTDATELTKFTRELIITEPGAITMRNSGIKLYWNTNNFVSYRISIGSQAFRSYTSSGGVVAGGFCIQQRMDSGSAQGAGITLIRGSNNLECKVYGHSTTILATNLSGYFVVNYESDVPAAGLEFASHTIYQFVYAHTGASYLNNRTFTFSNTATTYENEHFVHGLGFNINLQSGSFTGGVAFNIKDPADNRVISIYSDLVISDAESGYSDTYASSKNVFKRYPEDPASNINFFSSTSRSYRFLSTFAVAARFISIASIHMMEFTAAGNISGNDAALPTTVKLVRADTEAVEQEQVLSAGTTSFSFVVRNNVLDYYIDAYQDATHVGRSALAKAA
jgi:hypothetical protein